MVVSGPARQAMLSEGSDPANPPKQTFKLNLLKTKDKKHPLAKQRTFEPIVQALCAGVMSDCSGVRFPVCKSTRETGVKLVPPGYEWGTMHNKYAQISTYIS